MQKSVKNNFNYDTTNIASSHRKLFHIPTKNGKDTIYFCGNSLGLQPKTTAFTINRELDNWAKYGVDAHFESSSPWFNYHTLLTNSLANLAGALPVEVVAMNALTVNLHLLMVSFYCPTLKKNKILIEDYVFPSDKYAIDSQIKFHGYLSESSIIKLKPRVGEYTLRTEDILNTIELHKEELALIFIGGVNYYTGQVFEMEKIAQKANQIGCKIGFDLAHAIGNVPLKLHDWNVDFATWCSYKYLNGGPGCVSGVFIHQKHFSNNELPRFEGWWGNAESTRFEMDNSFEPMVGAQAWQLSNAPILSMAALRASLDIFDQVDFSILREKSILMTNRLYETLIKYNQITILTPDKEEERGCQISILCHDKGYELYQYLIANNMVVDWRKPNVIRITPVPLYNTMEDVSQFLIIFAAFF